MKVQKLRFHYYDGRFGNESSYGASVRRAHAAEATQGLHVPLPESRRKVLQYVLQRLHLQGPLHQGGTSPLIPPVLADGGKETCVNSCADKFLKHSERLVPRSSAVWIVLTRL